MPPEVTALEKRAEAAVDGGPGLCNTGAATVIGAEGAAGGGGSPDVEIAVAGSAGGGAGTSGPELAVGETSPPGGEAGLFGDCCDPEDCCRFIGLALIRAKMGLSCDGEPMNGTLGRYSVGAASSTAAAVQGWEQVFTRIYSFTYVLFSMAGFVSVSV